MKHRVVALHASDRVCCYVNLACCRCCSPLGCNGCVSTPRCQLADGQCTFFSAWMERTCCIYH